MINEVIQKYLDKLDTLRENEIEFKNYEFKLNDDGKRDINQFNRFSIGVGLFNDLRIPSDYPIVKFLFKEEKKHRESQTDNYEYETIYMYSYFLSKFRKIEDIWEFAELKFDGSMDSDSGFETGFFLTYGKENLRKHLNESSHKLRKKIERKIFDDESWYSDESGKVYQENQIAYFGLKKPVVNPLHFYWSLNEKDYFKEEFEKWKFKTDLNNPRNAYDYVNYAEYIGDEKEIEKAMVNHIKVAPEDWSSDKYRKKLGIKKKESLFNKIMNWKKKK